MVDQSNFEIIPTLNREGSTWYFSFINFFPQNVEETNPNHYVRHHDGGERSTVELMVEKNTVLSYHPSHIQIALWVVVARLRPYVRSIRFWNVILRMSLNWRLSCQLGQNDVILRNGQILWPNGRREQSNVYTRIIIWFSVCVRRSVYFSLILCHTRVSTIIFLPVFMYYPFYCVIIWIENLYLLRVSVSVLYVKYILDLRFYTQFTLDTREYWYCRILRNSQKNTYINEPKKKNSPFHRGRRKTLSKGGCIEGWRYCVQLDWRVTTLKS